MENYRRTCFRDHWQRVVHACSDCTFSHLLTFSNQNSRARCAKTVECGNSLWKRKENLAEIPGRLTSNGIAKASVAVEQVRNFECYRCSRQSCKNGRSVLMLIGVDSMAKSPAGRKIRARLQKGLCIGCGKSPCVCANTQQVRKARELARVEAAILDGTKSELEWAAEYCQKRARGAWDPNRKERSEYWIRLKAQVADALAKAMTSSE